MVFNYAHLLPLTHVSGCLFDCSGALKNIHNLLRDDCDTSLYIGCGPGYRPDSDQRLDVRGCGDKGCGLQAIEPAMILPSYKVRLLD